MSKDLTDALRELTLAAQEARSQKPAAMQPRGSVDKKKSSAMPKSSSEDAGGIASPLVESAYADRQWHSQRTSTSTDGIWVIRMRPIKSIKFKDRRDSTVTLDFKEPA